MRGWSGFLPFAIVLFGGGLTVWASHELSNTLDYRAWQRFEVAAERMETVLDAAGDDAIQRLRAVQGFMTALPSADPDQFQKFLRDWQLSNADPSIRAIAFAPKILPGEFDVLARRLREAPDSFRERHYPPFEMFPKGERPVYFPTILVEPPTARKGVLGYDLASNPERLEAANRAISQSAVRSSAPVVLSQDADEGIRSLLLVAPIYGQTRANVLDGSDLADRVLGVAALGYTPAFALDAGRQALGGAWPALEVVDREEAEAGTPLVQVLSVPALDESGQPVTRDDAGPVSLVRESRFGGRVWDLRFSGVDVFRVEGAGALVWTVFLSGLLITAVLALAARALLSERDWLARGVANRTRALEAANRELQAKRRQAEDANAAKSQFLALMSHELRTPLNAIIGFSEIIRDQVLGPVDNKSYRNYAADINTSGIHLLDLINDILDLSKVEAGEAHPDQAAIRLADCLELVETLLAHRAETAGLTFEVLDRTGDLVLNGDPRMMRQMLVNLCSNAIKFTEPGGRVTVSHGRDAGNNVWIAVEDTGIGMTEQEIEQAMQPFRQVDNVLNRTHTGTGLGLPLVSRLVGLHDGRLELDSWPGRGTTARLVFPANRVLEDMGGVV